MTQLIGIRQAHQTKPTVFTDKEDRTIGIEAIGYPAYQIPCLNRSDDQPVFAIVKEVSGVRRKELLGVIAPSPPGGYRIIAYGTIASPPDSSLEFEWETAIEVLYKYADERQKAANRITKIRPSDKELMTVF